jgi:hypothetical protein
MQVQQSALAEADQNRSALIKDHYGRSDGDQFTSIIHRDLCSKPSRYLLIYHITFLGWLQEIGGDINGKLMVFRPLTNSIKILAFVACVEINICLRPFRVPPNLAEDTCVDLAHELLTNDIETVSYILR